VFTTFTSATPGPARPEPAGADDQHRREVSREQICGGDAAKDELTDAEGDKPTPLSADGVDGAAQ